jgi:hypothetical protein
VGGNLSAALLLCAIVDDAFPPTPNPSPPLRCASWGEGNLSAVLSLRRQITMAVRVDWKEYALAYEAAVTVGVAVVAGADWLGTLY